MRARAILQAVLMHCSKQLLQATVKRNLSRDGTAAWHQRNSTSLPGAAKSGDLSPACTQHWDREPRCARAASLSRWKKAKVQAGRVL